MDFESWKESSQESLSPPFLESRSTKNEGVLNAKCQLVLPSVDNESCEDTGKENNRKTFACAGTNTIKRSSSSSSLLTSLAEEQIPNQSRQRSASYSFVDQSTTTKRILTIWRKRASSSASSSKTLATK